MFHRGAAVQIVSPGEPTATTTSIRPGYATAVTPAPLPRSLLGSPAAELSLKRHAKTALSPGTPHQYQHHSSFAAPAAPSTVGTAGGDIHLLEVIRTLQAENTALKSVPHAALIDPPSIGEVSALPPAPPSYHDFPEDPEVGELSLRTLLVKLQSDVNELTRVSDKKTLEIQLKNETIRSLEEAVGKGVQIQEHSAKVQSELNRAVDEVHYLRVENQCIAAERAAAEKERETLQGERVPLLARSEELDVVHHRLVAVERQCEAAEILTHTLQTQLDASTAAHKNATIENDDLSAQLRTIATHVDATPIPISDTAVGGPTAAARILERVDALYERSSRAEAAAASNALAAAECQNDVVQRDSVIDTLQGDLQAAAEAVEVGAARADADHAVLGEEVARLTASHAEGAKTLQHYEREVSALRSYNKSLEAAHRDTQQRLHDSEANRRTVESTLFQTSADKTELEQRLQKVGTAHNSSQTELGTVRQNLVSSESRVQELQATVASLLEDLSAERNDRGRIEADMAATIEARNTKLALLSERLAQRDVDRDSATKQQACREEELIGRAEAARVEKNSLVRDYERLSMEVSGLKTERDTALGEARELLTSVTQYEHALASLREENTLHRSQLQSRHDTSTNNAASFEPVRAVLEQRLACWARDNEELHLKLTRVTEERDSLLVSLGVAPEPRPLPLMDRAPPLPTGRTVVPQLTQEPERGLEVGGGAGVGYYAAEREREGRGAVVSQREGERVPVYGGERGIRDARWGNHVM